MGLPLAKTELPDEPRERIFRAVEGDDGEVRVLQIVPTREDLLNPRLDDKLTQSNKHLLTLVPLFDALKRYLKRLAPDLSVFSDLLLLYKKHGYAHNTSPDIAVVEGLPEGLEDQEVLESLDVIGEGGRLRLVVEVVSTSSRTMVDKDEKDNVELFASLGVEDYVLVYPPVPGRPLEVYALKLTGPPRFQRYVHNPPDPEGRIDLSSVGLWLCVEKEGLGRPVLVHQGTGQRLLSAEEEERRASEAEQRAEQAEQRTEQAEQRTEQERRRADEAQRRSAELLVTLLTARGLTLDDEARERILSCRDAQQLQRWAERAATVKSVGDLWNS